MKNSELQAKLELLEKAVAINFQRLADRQEHLEAHVVALTRVIEHMTVQAPKPGTGAERN